MNKSLEELHTEYLAANAIQRALAKATIDTRRKYQDAINAESVAWVAYKKRADSAYRAAFKMGAQDE